MAAMGSTFAGWGGACSGTGSCQVTMSSAQTVAATFTAAKPVLSGLRVSPRRFSLAGRKVSGRCVKPTAKNKSKPRCRPIKLKVSYILTRAVSVTFTITGKAQGRKVNGRCVKPTKKNKTHKKCTRTVKVKGSITQNGNAGTNTFTFNGKIGGHKLGPGTYNLIATPTGGTPQEITFQIIP
jgi:hypothetical protein